MQATGFTMLHWLAAIWMGMLGACLGSFLNVIVYRLPRGMSIVAPGSRCPHCRQPIRWHHNIPIVSWLVLRGRCTDCGSRIAVRYPLVEAVTASFFLLAFATEPEPAVGSGLPAGHIVRMAAAGYHGLLMTWLFCFWLTEREAGHPESRRFPWWLAACGVACGPLLYAAAAGVWQATAIDGASLTPIVEPSAPGLARRGLGMLVAGLLAGAAWPVLAVGPMGRQGRLVGVAGLLVVGGFLGPALAMLAAVAAATALLVATCGTRWLALPGSLSWTTCLLCIMLAWLLARPAIVPSLADACQMVGKPALSGCAVLATGVLSLAAATISRKSPAR